MNGQDLTDYETGQYVEYAETEEEPVYTIDFITGTLCSGELEVLSVDEFGACSNYYASQAVISFGNIIIGILLGFMVVKGLFETWR